MDVQLIFVLQVFYESRGIDGELLVVGPHEDVAETHAVGVAAHTCMEIQRQHEAREHGSEGSRDVTQLCASLYQRRAVEEYGVALLLLWHLYVGGVYVHRRPYLLHHDVAKMNLLAYNLCLCLQLTYVEAGSSVASHAAVE